MCYSNITVWGMNVVKNQSFIDFHFLKHLINNPFEVQTMHLDF